MELATALAAIFGSSAQLVIAAGGVFARIGAALFFLPGIGERSVPMRVRLGAALAIAVLLSPMIRPFAADVPDTPLGLGTMLLAETVTGLALGFAFRLLIFALQVSGMIIAQQLSVAQMFGSGVALDPEPTIATLLSVGGIALLMMAGLHIAFVARIAELYTLVPFGQFPLGGDLAEWSIGAVSRTFAIGVSLALPFLVIGFAYNLALGALSRAMPQLLVALVGAPFIIWVGIAVLVLTIPHMFEMWQRIASGVFLDPFGGMR